MKAFQLFLFVYLCAFQISLGQILNGKISGTIKNEQNTPLDGATVSLFRKKDSTLLRNQATNSDGKFVFTDLNLGSYYISAFYIGYRKFFSTAITLDNRNQEVPLTVFTLQKSDKQKLQEVSIISTKQLIEEQIDRTVVNPNVLISSAAGNLIEVLAKSPGVTITPEGEISLNGRGVMIIIDDKPTYLASSELANYLKSIPVITVDKIELMSNPPAKYDASGSAIINIRLKKNRTAGFNGNLSLSYNQGRYGRMNNGLNLNYRIKKMNIFGNLNYGLDANYSEEENLRFFNPDQENSHSIFLRSKYNMRSKGLNGRFGLDLFITSKTTIGLIFTGGVKPKRDYLYYNSSQKNVLQQTDSTGFGSTLGNYNWKNSGLNFNFNHQFNQSGKELSVDLDYIQYDYSTKQIILGSSFPSSQISASSYGHQVRQPVQIDIYAAKSDYTQHFLKQGRLDAGIKSSIVNTDNNNLIYNLDQGNMLPDYERTNRFVYRENINAAYLNINNSWKRFAVQVGLRFEHTYASGNQRSLLNGKDSSFTKNYADIFPTVYLSYKLDSTAKNTLILSFGRRIRRPNYQQLNPFLLLQDQYSYSIGNTELKSIYNNRIELKYSYAGRFNLTLAYDRVQGSIFSSKFMSGNVLVTRPENLLKGYGLGFIPNISLSPRRWWSINANVLILHLVNKGNVSTEEIDERITTGGFNLINQFKINKKWSIDFFTLYRAKSFSGQTEYSAYWYNDAGVQMNILKDKGSLKLSFNDIFQTFITKDNTIAIRQAQAFHSSETDSQRIGITFTYNFGKDIFARNRNRSSKQSDTELERSN